MVLENGRNEKMLSVRGIYENGRVRLLEHLSKKGSFEVNITFLENKKQVPVKKDRFAGLLSDLYENDFEEFLDYSQNREQDWFRGRKTDL